MAAGLRRRGIEVTTAADTGLRGATDEAHLEFGFHRRRVVVALDADFLAISARGFPHAGIAYCHPKLRTIGQIIRALETMDTLLNSDQMMNRVQFI